MTSHQFSLKNAPLNLPPILSKLFQLSYESSIFPESWKIARVTPIPKKGDSSQITNYRQTYRDHLCSLQNNGNGYEPTRPPSLRK